MAKLFVNGANLKTSWSVEDKSTIGMHARRRKLDTITTQNN